MKVLKDLKETRPGLTLVELTGDIDYVSYSELKKLFSKLISSGHKNIIIDFTDTKHIDSSGIGAVTSANIKVNSLNGKLYLVSSKTEINKIFDITGLSKVMKIYPNVQMVLDEIEAKRKKWGMKDK